MRTRVPGRDAAVMVVYWGYDGDNMLITLGSSSPFSGGKKHIWNHHPNGYTILYHTILYYTTLHCTILFYIYYTIHTNKFSLTSIAIFCYLARLMKISLYNCVDTGQSPRTIQVVPFTATQSQISMHQVRNKHIRIHQPWTSRWWLLGHASADDGIPTIYPTPNESWT